MISDLLTTKELQDVPHVDRTTIYRMAESGRIPAVKVGNQWRFPRQQTEPGCNAAMAQPVRDVTSKRQVKTAPCRSQTCCRWSVSS